MRVGIGFDAHRLVDGRRLVLGGLPIEHGRGLEGHSDGDAVLHALADALLGAVAAPDIGSLFPSTDPQWAGASSDRFVREACRIVASRGLRVEHVDLVIIAAEPRLAPHVDSMRARLAEILGIEPDSVGLKATTTDGMGFTGRGEGIAVQAVATVTDERPGAGDR